MPSPKAELPRMYEEKNLDLDALYDGGNPFDASDRNPNTDRTDFSGRRHQSGRYSLLVGPLANYASELVHGRRCKRNKWLALKRHCSAPNGGSQLSWLR